MQARVRWSQPSGALGRLVDRSVQRAAELGAERDWEERAAEAPAPPPFGAAFQSDRVSVIAELKRRSPSRGALNPAMDAGERALLYEGAGAAALSILTEPTEFGGSMADLETARRTVSVPLLRKDFLVRPVQAFEARAGGASAVLLIVRALGPQDTAMMIQAARSVGLEALFEVRDEDELGWALDAGARFVGVNRRDLETLVLEDGVVEHLLPMVPPQLFAVAESGVATPADVERTADLGADAVLVGSALSTAADPEALLASLTTVRRRVGSRV